MKEFIKYFFERPLRDDGKGKMWFTLNYTWAFASFLFIGLFLYGVHKYQAPIFYYLAIVPFLMLIYNIIEQYNQFIYKNTGFRKITSFALMIIFYGAGLLDLLILIGILFCNRTN